MGKRTKTSLVIVVVLLALLILSGLVAIAIYSALARSTTVPSKALEEYERLKQEPPGIDNNHYVTLERCISKGQTIFVVGSGNLGGGFKAYYDSQGSRVDVSYYSNLASDEAEPVIQIDSSSCRILEELSRTLPL